MIVDGVFLVLVVQLPLVMIAVVSGLLGLGAGVHHQRPAAIGTVVLGLVLMGCGVCVLANVLTHF